MDPCYLETKKWCSGDVNEPYMGCRKLECGDEILGVKPGMLQGWARPTPDCGGTIIAMRRMNISWLSFLLFSSISSIFSSNLNNFSHSLPEMLSFSPLNVPSCQMCLQISLSFPFL